MPEARFDEMEAPNFSPIRHSKFYYLVFMMTTMMMMVMLMMRRMVVAVVRNDHPIPILDNAQV